MALREATASAVNVEELQPAVSSSPALYAELHRPGSFVEIRRDVRTNELTLSTPMRLPHGSYDSPNLSAASSPQVDPPGDSAEEETRARMRVELADTFTQELAHLAYVTFSRLAGKEGGLGWLVALTDSAFSPSLDRRTLPEGVPAQRRTHLRAL